MAGAAPYNALKLNQFPSFKMSSMEAGTDAADSPTRQLLPSLNKARSSRLLTTGASAISIVTTKLLVGALFLAFLLGAATSGTAVFFAKGDWNQYTGSSPVQLHTSLTRGRHLAAVNCNQFNVAVSQTVFKGTTKSGDSVVGIWEATITNQCATGAVSSLTVSTDGRYNPAGGSNPRSQTGLQNCSPPTVNKNGVVNGPVTCQVILPAGGLGAGQGMTFSYVDNNNAGGPPAHSFAAGTAVYGAPVSTPTPTQTQTQTQTQAVACNQFNVAVSATTFVSTTKSGDTTVGIWKATVTNKCAAGALTTLTVSTDGRYNPAGGNPRSQTGLQNCSPPTVNKNGVVNGPVTCQVILPAGGLGAGQTLDITYVDNNLAGSPPAHTFAVGVASYGTPGTPAPTATQMQTQTPTQTPGTPAPTQTQTQTQAPTSTPTAVNCNQFNVAVSPTTFVTTSKSGDSIVGIWKATVTNQCAGGKVTNLVVSTNGRYNPAGGNPRSQTGLQNCSPPTVNKNGVVNGPVTCQVVLANGALGAGQSMDITYVDNNLAGSPPQFSFATSTAAFAPN